MYHVPTNGIVSVLVYITSKSYYCWLMFEHDKNKTTVVVV